MVVYMLLFAITYIITSVLVFDLLHITVRRNLGGRNLWESRDDRKWGHDKFFEEITTQERRREEVDGVSVFILNLCLEDIFL